MKQLHEDISQIKANAYGIVNAQVIELMEENKKLKEGVKHMDKLYKALEQARDTIYTFKTAGMLNVDEIINFADHDPEIQAIQNILNNAKTINQ